MSQNLKINAGTLADQCWTTPQAFANDFANVSSVLLGDITGIIISDTAPGVNDRDKGWLKTSAGSPVYSLIFKFYNGQWVARHPVPYSGNERRIWVGDLTALQTYDGGSAGAVTDVSGPFWERDTAFDGRSMVGVGTIPGTSPARSIAAELATQDSSSQTGEWVHTIARAELPAEPLHLFADEVKGEPVEDIDANDTVVRYSNPDSEAQSYRMAAGTASNPSVGKTENLGSGTSFVNAPPFIGVYIIKRTTRKFYVG